MTELAYTAEGRKPKRASRLMARPAKGQRAKRAIRPASEDTPLWIAPHCRATRDKPTSPTPMPDNLTKPRIKPTLKTERPKLHKVILLNDDFTPREFVVSVLKAEFHVGEDLANKIMITAHRRGVCVVAVFTRDVAETKATRATDAGKAKGYPLMFTTEPEE
jgi:ATP-dependent Clp protease adaptor protein ClpS